MSALTERLLKQLLRLRDRELELETKRREWENKLQQEEGLKLELSQEQERLARVRKVQETLEQLNAETESKYKAVQEDDERQRTKISEELKVRIAEADEMTRDLTQREQRARSRKELLLRQQEIYDQHSSSGKEKFKELVAKRETETDVIVTKNEENIRRAPQLKLQLETESTDLATAKEAQKELKEKVDVFLARFATVQEQLNEAKKVYESASTDKHRHMRTLKALESDIEMLRRRFSTSKAERDREKVKVEALKEKVEAVRTQIARFEGVIHMLTSTETGEAANNTA